MQRLKQFIKRIKNDVTIIKHSIIIIITNIRFGFLKVWAKKLFIVSLLFL